MSPRPVPNRVVLVVDDEALIRWSLCEALTESGYSVAQAGSAAEARAALDEHERDFLTIVLDLRLPDTSDLSLLRDIRERRPDVPVIVMTAYGTPDDAREAEALGVSRIVDKPFDVQQMIQLVAAVGA